MNEKNQKICIVLPNKIGDSILAIPFLICLKQLIQKYQKIYSIEVLCSNGLLQIFQSLNIFPVKKLSLIEKIKSQIFPYDKAVFLDTSSRNMFLKSKHSLGLNIDVKKYIKFDENLPFLDPRDGIEPIPQDLFGYLTGNMNLAVTSSSFVAINLYLDFNKEQIIETFEFSPEIIDVQGIQNIKATDIHGKYVVTCMEAGSGKKTAKDRLWNCQNYFSIADYLHKNYGIKTVFIGIDSSNPVPQKDYLVDLRGKLNLLKVAKVISRSIAYIGNDTGPLHIANLLKKPSIALYQREGIEKQYAPVFPQLNIQLLKPDVSDVINKIDLLMEKYSGILL